MSQKRNNHKISIQELILRGYNPKKRENVKQDKQSGLPKYSKLHEEEASMNKYILQLKCLLKNLRLLEEGMVYIGKMKPIIFEPIYVLAQMQAKLYKFRNRLGHLPKEHRKYAHNLIGNAYDKIIDQCIKGAQVEDCLKKIVSDVAYIDSIVTKYCKANVDTIIPYPTNIIPWLIKNNMKYSHKLPFKKVDKNYYKFKLKNNKKLPKCKKIKCNRVSSFMEKIKDLKKQEKEILYNTADKTVSACVSTFHTAIQFDPNLSGPIPIPESFGEVENKIRSSWLANTKKSSQRTSIEEKIPPENSFQYEVSMRHASTNVIYNKNTKETQTKIQGLPSGEYEYTVMDMKYTKERIANEKTKEEMITNLKNKKVFCLNETDIFETPSSDRHLDSESSSGTIVEDSDCKIKISNVESKPYYKKYKMIYCPNKDGTHRSSNYKSVLINKDAIEHKAEILAYIKELGSILVNSCHFEQIEETDTDG